MIYQYELAGCMSDSAYQNAIPSCCEYQTTESHHANLMLCWGLILDIEKGTPRDCTGCECDTRNHQ
jgi:hypothetical protein